MKKSNTIIFTIQELEKAKTDKKKYSIIESAWNNDNENFFIGVELSMTKKYNLSLVPYLEDEYIGDFSFRDFYDLSKAITSEEYSEKGIKKLIDEAVDKSSTKEWNLVYRRILLNKFHTDIPLELVIKFLQTIKKH